MAFKFNHNYIIKVFLLKNTKMEDLLEKFKKLKLEESPTGLVYHPDTLEHYPNFKERKLMKFKHVENPNRVFQTSEFLKFLFKHLMKDKVEFISNNDNKIDLEYEESRGKSKIVYLDHFDEISNEHLRRCHGQKYTDLCLDIFSEKLKESDMQQEKFIYNLSGDVYFSHGTARASKLAAQATLIAIDHVLENKWSNSFVLTRPPGHHARTHGLKDIPEGFCFFNNVAIGAKYLQEVKGFKKVAIFDWDVHHGDGTQQIFENDSNTLYVSTHQYEGGKFYPCDKKGDCDYVGEKQGEGFCLNAGFDLSDENLIFDEDYLFVFECVLLNIIASFEPQFIIISSGFDSCRGDPLGGFDISPRSYFHIATKLKEQQQNIISVLEGGYKIENIEDGSLATIAGFLNQKETFLDVESIKIFKKKKNQLEIEKRIFTKLENRDWELKVLELKDMAPCQYILDTCERMVKIHSKFWGNIKWTDIEKIIFSRRKRRGLLDQLSSILSKRIRTLYMGSMVIDTKECKKSCTKQLVQALKKDGLPFYESIQQKYISVSFRQPFQLFSDDGAHFKFAQFESRENLIKLTPTKENIIFEIPESINYLTNLINNSLNQILRRMLLPIGDPKMREELKQRGIIEEQGVFRHKDGPFMYFCFSSLIFYPNNSINQDRLMVKRHFSKEGFRPLFEKELDRLLQLSEKRIDGIETIIKYCETIPSTFKRDAALEFVGYNEFLKLSDSQFQGISYFIEQLALLVFFAEKLRNVFIMVHKVECKNLANLKTVVNHADSLANNNISIDYRNPQTIISLLYEIAKAFECMKAPVTINSKNVLEKMIGEDGVLNSAYQHRIKRTISMMMKDANDSKTNQYQFTYFDYF